MKSKSFLHMGFAALIASCFFTSGASADPKSQEAAPSTESLSKQADSKDRAGNLTATIHDLAQDTVFKFEELCQPYVGMFDIVSSHDAPVGGEYRIQLKRPEGAVVSSPGSVHTYALTIKGDLGGATTANIQWHKEKGLIMSCMNGSRNTRNIMILDLANPFSSLGLNSALTTAAALSDQQKTMSEKGRRLIRQYERIKQTPDPVAEILDREFGIAEKKPDKKTN